MCFWRKITYYIYYFKKDHLNQSEIDAFSQEAKSVTQKKVATLCSIDSRKFCLGPKWLGPETYENFGR